MKLVLRPAALALVLTAGLILAPTHFGAQESSSKRKLLNHEAPPYPTLARNVALEGVVKADVVVSPDGSVISVRVLSGHPVLAQAAMNTIRQWKWEAASSETHELVMVRFSRPE